jgi:predicted O-methyltransferase YrrM
MISKPQIFRPFDKDPNALRYRRHPAFCLTKLRGVIAEHSEAEELMLQKYASGRTSLVEIGVAEGASALAMRRVANSSAVLHLVDPYTPGRIPGINLTQMCARKHVNQCTNATVHFLEDYSYAAAKHWQTPIDFLFIDGDHSYEACLNDWRDWSPFVTRGGVVAFHDARTFPGGWPREDWGPVIVVNELFREQPNSDWQIIDEVDSLVVVRRLPVV